MKSTTRGSLPESWRVCLPIFEGPLDLLLHLVRINEVEITDIPVALICDQFYEYLGLMEELDLDIAGEYIYEAALLIQIKSRMLLPLPAAGEDESESDPRQELVQRLLEYQQLKEAAQTLAEVHQLRRGIWTRRPQHLDNDTAEEAELEMAEVSLFDLLTTFKTVLERYDREHPEPLVFHGETFGVRDQLQRLLQKLDAGRPLPLLDYLAVLSCRAEAIASFLAVLELARLQLIRIHQGDRSDILLYRTTRELQAHELEAIQG